MTLGNEEYFDKVKTATGTAYVTKNYPGPIAMDAKVSECHTKGCRTLETASTDLGIEGCTKKMN